MPLIIPKTLPAYDALYEENVFVMHRERALSQHIRPLGMSCECNKSPAVFSKKRNSAESCKPDILNPPLYPVGGAVHPSA